MKLIIAEKPSVAKSIAAALGVKSGDRCGRPRHDVLHAQGPDRRHRYGCADPCH